MPKKLAVEKLELDSVTMEVSVVNSTNKMLFNSTVQADENDVSSLDLRISEEEDLRASKVASLDTDITAEENLRGSKVGSLDARVEDEEELRGSKVGSLDLRVSEEEDLRASKVASLDTDITAEENLRGSKVGSLTTRASDEEDLRGSKVGSLNTDISTEEDIRASKIGSLETDITTEANARGSKVGSLEDRIGDEEATTQIITQTIPNGSDSVAVIFASHGLSAYSTAPAVAGMMRYTGNDENAPIVIPMLSGEATTTGATFVFTDATSSAGYKLDVIVTK
jgi:hypothetical protein